MRYVQVSKETLAGCGFVLTGNAAAYYPSAQAATHIHLGTSVSYVDNHVQHQAESGNVYIMFVSFKRDGRHWFELVHRDDGMFSFPRGFDASRLPDGWGDILDKLYIVK